MRPTSSSSNTSEAVTRTPQSGDGSSSCSQPVLLGTVQTQFSLISWEKPPLNQPMEIDAISQFILSPQIPVTHKAAQPESMLLI